MRRDPAEKTKRTILLVDDEPVVLKIMQPVLEAGGFRVLAAASAEEALVVFQSNPDQFDLLITDVMLPELDGPGLARRILDTARALPVLFISGIVHERDLATGMNSHQCAFLRKPFVPATLIQKVEELLGASRPKVMRSAGP